MPPDRIIKTVYTAADQVLQVISGHGVQPKDEAQYRYTDNGLATLVYDGENNVTRYDHDGHDRLARTTYPSPAKDPATGSGTGTLNWQDYEQLSYALWDGGLKSSSLVSSVRLRDGQAIGLTHDRLSRLSLKDLPGAEPDTAYAYDNLGRLTSAAQPGHALSFAYDALGRQLSETGPRGKTEAQYDLAGRRTRLAWPGSNAASPFAMHYDHLLTGEITHIRENGATSGIGVLARFGYDDQGRRTSLTRGNGTVTSYAYDAVSRRTWSGPMRRRPTRPTGSTGSRPQRRFVTPPSRPFPVCRWGGASACGGPLSRGGIAIHRRRARGR